MAEPTNESVNLSSQKSKKIEYNATRKRIQFSEYGRLVQDMVEYALTLEDRKERQIYTEAIVQVMMGVNPKMKDVHDYQHKIWDHLALMSNYELDIDYPFEIQKHDSKPVTPRNLSYPKGHIHFRHYGRLIEKAMKKLETMPDDKNRDDLIQVLGNRMKRNLADWKGDGIEDAKVARDIAFYTHETIQPDFSSQDKQLIQIGENKFRTRKNKGLY